MEPFDGDVFSALMSPSISKKSKKKMIIKMAKILHDQMFKYDLVCYDIKPENYVYKNKNNVKMIDFGIDWCYVDKAMDDKNKEIIYLILLVQLGSLMNEMGLGINSNKVLKSIPIFKNRMKYMDQVIEKLWTNGHLRSVFKHYTLGKGQKYNPEFIKNKVLNL
jgi:hypothetical protein